MHHDESVASYPTFAIVYPISHVKHLCPLPSMIQARKSSQRVPRLFAVRECC